jgi:hypothetical protein
MNVGLVEFTADQVIGLNRVAVALSSPIWERLVLLGEYDRKIQSRILKLIAALRSPTQP